MALDQRIVIASAVIAALCGLQIIRVFFCGGPIGPSYEELLKDVDGPELLKKHSEEFNKKEVIKVTDGVYMAIGYALANSIMLEGPEAVVIVDVTESLISAKEVYEAFRNITDKPIKALIYTHNHADHMNGAAAFVEDPENPPEIWSHVTTLNQFHRFFTTSPILVKRAMRQFGPYNTAHINSGIGYKLKFTPDSLSGLIFPNKFLEKDEEEFEIGGMKLTLMHIPGETPDQIAVWYKEKDVLLPADDIYRAFPNLYAIRGTPNRDVRVWVNSLTKMRSCNAKYLVPSHTRPVYGEKEIYDLFTDYKDAIQFVHDQTVRYMNKGLLPDEIVPLVKLPSRLENHPFLLQFYGTVEWSVKSVFNTYLGWFSGDPADLTSKPPKEKSQQVIDLAGGVKKILEAAQKALDNKDAQWGLELSSHVYRVDPTNADAIKIRINALKDLGSRQISANGRNYYLTCALETIGLELTASPQAKVDALRRLPIYLIFEIMALKFDVEQCSDYNKNVVFNFTDTEDVIVMNIRNSIVELSRDVPEVPEVEVTLTSVIWRQILTKDTSPASAYMSGDFSVSGMWDFKNVMSCFEID